MSVDAWIDRACEPRRSLGDSLLELVKARGRIELIERLAAQAGTTPERLGMDLTGPAGVEQPLDYRELQGQTEPLRSLEAHCEGCPANLWAPSFGCFTAIRYPIEPEAERWILERLPADLSTSPGIYLARAIEEFEIRGERVRQMRQQGLLAHPDGLARRYGPSLVTADQVLELLLFIRLDAPSGRLFLILFGAVEPVPADQLQAAIGGQHPLRQAVFLAPDDPPSVSDFKRLFISLLAAVQLETVVRMVP